MQAVAGADHNISVISIVEARVIALLQGGLPIGMTFMTHKLLACTKSAPCDSSSQA